MEELSLAAALKVINETSDDFASKPALTANDIGAFGDYPLHKAAIWGDVRIADALLRNGADVNAAGEDGDTPLHRAVAGKSGEVVRLLVAHGARTDIVNRYGRSAVEDASSCSNPDIRKFLANY